MTSDALLEKLLRSYKASYDIEQNCKIGGDIYDAYASFNVSNAKYVLIKKAELWRANCFEHVLFRIEAAVTKDTLGAFKKKIDDYIEPEIVRGGKKWPEKDHMYTYITAVYICKNGVDKETEKAVRKFRYVRNYKFTIRGYSEARILIYDMKSGRAFGNRAARDLIKGYKKAGLI